MIERILIEGFKRFERQSLELRPLTVFAGRNGAGKTSAIHSLLLVRQAVLRADGVVELNGPFGMELGWFEDIVNINTLSDEFSIGLDSGELTGAVWRFSEGDTELYAKVDAPAKPPVLFSEAKARGFQYLSAERIGPRVTQHSSALPKEMLEVGCIGQHVAQVLEKLGSAAVQNGRLEGNKDDALKLVKAQTEAWLSRIVRNVELDTTSFPGTDVVSLRFRSPGGEWVRPTNMGFGVSYCLPIIVAALTAADVGLLIVENPEAHLHPSGQSEMGIFLAQMANAGLQVLVETHSDHVLNGMRRAIGEARILPSTSAIVHFFPDEHEVRALEFTPTGGVNDWPSGFFDQYKLDVARLTRVRRP